MSDADPSAPTPPAKGERSELQGLGPGELLARGLHTVKPTVKAGPWEPPTAEEVSRLLPQYRIEKLVGRGGMGAVYKGIQKSLERPVAIKLLPAELTADKEFVARFEREARTLAKLQHSRIITIHDFGQTSDGHLYFVMEYIDGTDLRSILRGPGLNPDQVLILVGQLCDALQAAHREGIVHRDIKPENVLVTRDGYVKLADFGLARPPQEADTSVLTQTNMVMGTPDYMAPEQRFGASKADARSDIFALGVMLYEMLTGQTPRGVFDPPSRKVKVDVRIDEVVLKALQSEPERRYQKASEMRTDVERIRTTPPPSPAKASPPKRENRHSTLLAVAATAIVLLVAFAGYSLWPKLVHPSTSLVATASSDEMAGGQGQPRSPSANRSAAANSGKKEDGAADRVWMMSVGLATPVPQPANVASTPPLARIAPSSSTVAERETLEKALLSHAWTWTALGAESFSWNEVVFWKDGTMTTSTPANARWSVTGKNTVALQFNTGDRLVLTLHFNSDYFTGCRNDGKDVVNGWAKSGQEAMASPLAAQSSHPLLTATQAKPFVNTLWMKFVPVPGTSALFSVYETRVRDYAEYARNNPTDQTWQNATWNRTPLANRPEDPILCVNLADANAFCRWLSAREIAAGKLPRGMSYRLPTDAEWSLAVGLGVEEGRTPKERSDKNKTLFPWGVGFPPKMNAGNYADRTLKKEYPDHEVIEGYEDGFLLAASVGSFAPNQFGIYDLGGNAAELCADPFEPGNGLQLARGAAFSLCKEHDLLASHRFTLPASARWNWIGFRCVLSASEPPRGIATSTAPPGGSSPLAASAGSHPQANGPEPATTEQALLGTKWRIGNWEMHFQKDHVISVDEGAPPLRIWHWWVIESRKLHIQFAAESAFFDTSKGADITFDPGFTNFAGGKNGEVHGTRASAPVAQAPAKATSVPGGKPAPNPIAVRPFVPTKLEDMLAAYTWSWGTLGGGNPPPVVRFVPDGHVSGGWVWQWLRKPNGELQVDCSWGEQSHMYLIFNKEFSEFDAYDGGGGLRVKGRRLEAISQGEVAMNPPAQPVPPRTAVPPGAAPSATITTAAKKSLSHLANFVEQLPGATAWALAPLDVKAPPIIRENATLLKTGLSVESARSPTAWRPVYAQGMSVADLIVGTFQEREVDSARATTPQQWTARSSEIRTMLDGAETQFRNALQSAGGLSAYAGAADTTVPMAFFPPVPGPTPKPAAPEGPPQVSVQAGGPAGTNFGVGERKLKMHVNVQCNSPTPYGVHVDCYWVGWDGKHHTVSAPFHKDVSPYGDHPVDFDVNAVAERTNGATFGILGPAPGVYRGWLVSVHNGKGERVAVSSNVPGADRLVP